METFYMIPNSGEFANLCEWAYVFSAENEDAATEIAEHFDGLIILEAVADDEIEDLQKRMHLAEGCTLPNCKASDDYDEDWEGNMGCGLQIESADEFCEDLREDVPGFVRDDSRYVRDSGVEED